MKKRLDSLQTEAETLGLRLLLDENSESKSLIGLLRQSGHDVVGVRELGYKSETDLNILDLAILENRVLYTRDRGYYLWALERHEHPGIIVEHKLSSGKRNMSYQEILDALEQLQRVVSDIRNMVLTINSFKQRQRRESPIWLMSYSTYLLPLQCAHIRMR
jgi:predicted nuclease of predicted toxin-antitoxin system